uniref:BRCA2 DNA repair associated n=1 Tax=Gasterosteus aculeatus aculeatus TaxID=481459 RepID=A0AAQ4RV63_GASAC
FLVLSFHKLLGPLDPDWFETLTSQMFTEDNVSDQEDLCGNQEANFKTPFDKTAVDSQLLSTPKVFRHSRVVSPETEDERSFTGEFFPANVCEHASIGNTKFSSLFVFCVIQVTYDKQISESLGVQLHPDISWTSSLNTPSAVPSTLILSRTVNIASVLFLSQIVRKLFPSLSNASRVGRVSPQKNDAGQNPEAHDSPPGSLNQRDLDWKQTLPDAIEDGEIRRTVASVLEGAENVLSIFFTNSGSALRKVKTERIKRKQMTPTVEDGCISPDVSSTTNAVSCEQRTADKEPGRPPSRPLVETVDGGITQWSPLSLSDLPPCTLRTSFHDSGPVVQVENSVSPEQLQRDSASGRLVVRTPLKHTDTGFTKKKRKFVYTVETPKLQVPGKDKQCQRMESSPAAPDPGKAVVVHVKCNNVIIDYVSKPSLQSCHCFRHVFSGREVNVKRSQAPDEADFHSPEMNKMPKQGNLVDPTPRSPVRAKVHDPDLSQLRNDFVQDFSQMSDHCQLSKVQGDTPGTSFSPSACLSALKRAKQKTTHANPRRDLDDRRPVSDAHGSPASFVLPSSEISGLQWADKTGTPPSRIIVNGKAHSDDILQAAETDAMQSVGESQSLGPGRQRELHIESTSARRPSTAKEAVEGDNSDSRNGQARGNLPEKTAALLSVHPSGFQTASNRSIRITPSNLERAKRLFEEAEGEGTSRDQPVKCARDSKDEMSARPESMKNPTTKSNQPLSSGEANKDTGCQLTASQKADVTELCTLLEQADTQFEFTQFKTEKPETNCQADATSPLEVDNELDPAFLSGIDFDDSFSSEVEKHLTVAVVPDDEMISVSDGKTNPGERSQLQNESPLMPAAGFKTAGGNVLRLSKESLTRARALFADFEGHPVASQTSPDKQSSVHQPTGNLLHRRADASAFTDCEPISEFENMNAGPAESHSVVVQRNEEMDNLGCTKTLVLTNAASLRGNTCRQLEVSSPKSGGFQTASGKAVAVSSAALKKAKSLLSECVEVEDKVFVKPTHSKMPLPGLTPRNSGFLAASGKQVAFSSEALQKARALFSDITSTAEIPAASEAKNANEARAENTEQTHCAFTDTGSAKVHVSPRSPLEAKHLLTEFDGSISASAMQEADAFFKDCGVMDRDVGPSGEQEQRKRLEINISVDLGSAHAAFEKVNMGLVEKHEKMAKSLSPLVCGGFCTASGKNVSVSDDAMTKARSLLNENATFEDTALHPGRKQSGTFQEASVCSSFPGKCKDGEMQQRNAEGQHENTFRICSSFQKTESCCPRELLQTTGGREGG